MTQLSDWGRLHAADSPEVLDAIVTDIAIKHNHPIPNRCWFETAHDFLDTDRDYADLLLKAADRWEVLTEIPIQ